MSYDVHLEITDPESGQAVRVGSLDANHTSNTGGMIAEAAGKHLREWDALRAQVVAALCVTALREFASIPDYYRAKEPENKWGSLASTIEFLETIRDECVLAPAATFRVWA